MSDAPPGDGQCTDTHTHALDLLRDALGATVIAVNIERLSQLPPGENPAPRPPTAFQDYLGQHDIKRLRSWRAVS